MGDLGELIVAKGLKSCPKFNKSPNLVRLLLSFIPFPHHVPPFDIVLLDLLFNAKVKICFLYHFCISKSVYFLSRYDQLSFFKKNVPSSASFWIIVGLFQAHRKHFTTYLSGKMSIQYPVSGFELTTF